MPQLSLTNDSSTCQIGPTHEEVMDVTSSTWMESILHYAQDVSSAVLEGPREEDRYEWPALSSMYSYNNHLQWHYLVLRQYSGAKSQ